MVFPVFVPCLPSSSKQKHCLKKVITVSQKGNNSVSKRYSLMLKKPELSIFKNCISEMFRKKLDFFTYILPDYVFHESPKKILEK